MSESKPSTLNLFVPINKIDEEQRLVYGILAAQEKDNAGETFDYAGSKPYFQKWSDNAHATSGGKSKGNLRVMHTNKVAGVFSDIVFNDEAKQVECVAKVVDDAEWEMCKAGGYTGFSIGGRYVSRVTKGDEKLYVADPVEGSLVDKPCIRSATFEVVKADGTAEQHRFREDLYKGYNEDQERDDNGRFASGGGDSEKDNKDAAQELKDAGYVRDKDSPGESYAHPLSDKSGGTGRGVVTVANGRVQSSYQPTGGRTKMESHPDVKSAISHLDDKMVSRTISLKSDTGEDQMFVPTNDAILARATEMAKAAGKTGDADWLEFSDAARDDLVAKADATEHTDEGCAVENCDKCAAAKADEPEEPPVGGEDDESAPAEVPEGDEDAAKSDKPSLVDALGSLAAEVDSIKKGDTAEDDPEPLDARLNKFADFLADPEVLAKGLYEVSRTADIMRQVASLYLSVKAEAAKEGDNSSVPATLLSSVETIGNALIDMATEEVGEVMGRLRERDTSSSVETYSYPEAYCALAATTFGLEKADVPEFFNKAISISGKDQARLQKIHDHAASLGAACNKPDASEEDDLGAAEKLAKIDGVLKENSLLKADLAKATDQIEKAMPIIAQLSEDIAVLKAQPMPAAPRTHAVGKGDDVSGAVQLGGSMSLDQILGKAVEEFGRETVSLALIKAAQGNGTTVFGRSS